MATVKINERELVKYKRSVGPTVNGIKRLLQLSTGEKGIILRSIQKEWKRVIKLSFDLQAGIGANNKPFYWRPLSDRYEQFKKRKGLSPNILEASSPSLSQRYQDAVKYSSKDFRIGIGIPLLVTGPNRVPVRPGSKQPERVDAGVHQFASGFKDSEGIGGFGQIKRRLIKKTFIDIAKKKTLEYLTK